MTVEGVDYSAGRPGGAALRAAGKVFAMRYLSMSGNPKNLTHPEAVDLAAHGVWTGVVFETTAGRAGSGQVAGATDARSAWTQAAVCGKPPERPIYFAVDYDADPTEVAPYFQGVVSVLGLSRTGVYGGYRVVKYLLDHHLAAYAWQTAAWSNSQWDGRAQLRQHIGTVTINGVACDRDTAYATDYGQWQPGVVPNVQEEKVMQWSDKITIPGKGNPYNSKDQTATAGEWLGYGNQKAGAALAEVQALRQELAELQQTVAALRAAPVDVTALAKALAPLLSTETADVLSKRLES